MADLTLSQMLNLLPDNTTGQISPEDMRDIVTALKETLEGTNPVPALQFDVTPDASAHSPGRIYWDTENNTLAIDTSTAGASLSVGFEQWIRARNTTGSTILNGRPVYISGGQGSTPLVSPSLGAGRAVGLATEDIPNNSNGRVTTFGLVHDLDTSAFSDGNDVYVASTGLLSTSPSPSFVGVVLNAHPTQGIIFVRPQSFDHPDGTTAARPTTVSTGYMYFDTTLGKPIWHNGTNWVDATGSVV